jgi:hypothetical protein
MSSAWPTITEHTAMDVVTVSLLLQILAAFLAASLALGLPLGVALGGMIRRADRRHRQDVAQLLRSRTAHGAGWRAEQTPH